MRRDEGGGLEGSSLSFMHSVAVDTLDEDLPLSTITADQIRRAEHRSAKPLQRVTSREEIIMLKRNYMSLI